MISLSVLLVLLGPVIAYYIISCGMALINMQLDVLGVVFWMRNMVYFGIIPQATGVLLLCYFSYTRRFRLDASKSKRQLKTLAVAITLLCLSVGSLISLAPIVKANTISTTTYYLDTPLPLADYYIGNYSNGVYFAVNGSNWDNFAVGSNYTLLEQTCLSGLSSGTLYLGNVPWNYSLSVSSGVVVEEHYNTSVRRFINITNCKRSPYTVSTDGTYYFIQDKAGSYINSFISINASTTINTCLSYMATQSGGRLFFTKAEYTIYSQILIPSVITQIEGNGKVMELVGDAAIIKVADTMDEDAIYLNATTIHYTLKIAGVSVWCHSHNDSVYALHVKYAFNIYLEDFVSGWLGTCLENCGVIHMNNFESTDSANEGLKFYECGYIFMDGSLLDNCGGWGGISGYNAATFQTCTRIYWNNFNILGEKGSYGGQEKGIFFTSVGDAHLSNFEVDGFESYAIYMTDVAKIDLSSFEVKNCDNNALQLDSINGAVYDVSISTFKILMPGTTTGICLWSQNNYNVSRITVTAGTFIGEGGESYAVLLGDDASNYTNRCIFSDLIVSNSTHGIVEGYNSDYNIFSNIDTYTCTGYGVYLSGANSHAHDCWNMTSWIS